MKKALNISGGLTIIVAIVIVLFLGCKKEKSCKDVVQGDFELVE